ncbi:MAG: O-antigen ligase domain-containing protein [Oxalobacteraceae bacterium]|nr:MAG: O-antigen ligase domain-containing protein [Oxalobacteraceae bacterium]
MSRARTFWASGLHAGALLRERAGSGGRLWSKLPPLRSVMFVIGLLMVSLFLGLVSVMLGDIVAVKPVFFVALPALIVVAFTFFLSPMALVVAIMLVRAGGDPIFAGTQLGGGAGLGAVLNLALIGLAAMLVMRDPARVPRAAWWACIPFLTMIFVSVPYAPQPMEAIRPALAQLSTFAVFILAFVLVDDFKSLDKVLRLIVASSVPVVAQSLLAIARHDSYAVQYIIDAAAAGRYAAPLPHPNILAFYVVLVIGVVFYLLKRQRSTASRPLQMVSVCYLLVLFVVLFATKTRSAWVAAMLLFLLHGLFVEKRYLVYLVIAAVASMAIPDIRDRVMDLTQGNEVVQYARLNSFAWRKVVWTSGLSWMSPSHYLFGYGAGSFQFYFTTFYPQDGNGVGFPAHSVPVQMFFEQGLPGLLSFVWLFLSCARMMFPLARRELLGGVLFLALLLTYLVVSASDNMLAYLVYNWYFWLLVGAACAVAMRGDLKGGEVAPAGRRGHMVNQDIAHGGAPQ